VINFVRSDVRLISILLAPICFRPTSARLVSLVLWATNQRATGSFWTDDIIGKDFRFERAAAVLQNTSEVDRSWSERCLFLTTIGLYITNTTAETLKLRFAEIQLPKNIRL